MNASLASLTPRVWLVIPVETKAREFDAKLLLSAVAAEAGMGVILGNKNQVEWNARFFPKGVFFGNNFAADKVAAFGRYRRMGYRVAAWCEEGVAYRNRLYYRHERVSAEAISLADTVFAWGPYHAEDICAAIHEADRAKVIAAGSPRLDILRAGYRDFYRPESEALRSRFGRFLLVNTNFHRYNHYLGRGAYLHDLRDRGKLDTPEREAFSQRWVNYLGQMYRHFSEVIPVLLRAFPEHRIILRPHPSESFAAWRMEVGGQDRVEVISEGSVVPWILAAEALIHNSCTTGVEAVALGTPCFAYRPIVSADFDSFLPNAVSCEARSAEDLVSGLRAVVGGRMPAGLPETGCRLLSGLDGTLASDTIVAAIQRLSVAPTRFSAAKGREWLCRRWPQIRTALRFALRGPNRLTPYLEQKFPGLSLQEMQNALDRLRHVSGRFTNVHAVEIGKDTFALNAEASNKAPVKHT